MYEPHKNINFQTAEKYSQRQIRLREYMQKILNNICCRKQFYAMDATAAPTSLMLIQSSLPTLIIQLIP